MRRIILAVLLGFFVLAPTYLYVYSMGMVAGVARYKRSKQFQLTLYSMYRMGLMDGCTDDEACDLAGLGGGDDGGRR